MPIRIAYLDYSPHFAGAERALYTIISNLDRSQFDPVLIFPYPREHQHRYDDLFCEEIYLSNSVKWWMGSDRWKHPLRGTDFLKRGILGYRLAKELGRRNINILHVNLLRPDCLMWILPCKRKGIRVIGHFRSLPMTWVPSSKVQRLCDVIISVSKIVREHAMSQYSHPRNIVIYDSISSLMAENTDLRPLSIISSVAALFPNKGHDNAIRAFALIADKYTDYELHIVGGGNEKELERLMSIAAETKYISRIKFTKEQVENIVDVYSRSKLILSLTKEGEAFGLVPYEAALCNRPTIAPNKGAIKEILSDGISAILVDTENVEAIAQKIDWALSNYEECQNICKRTRQIVEARLSPQVMVRQIMDIYKSLSK